MGYYTDYELSALSSKKSDGKNFDELPPHMYDAINREVDKMDVFVGGNCSMGWNVLTTWNNWEDDMVLLSRKFPDALFMLHGSGEDPEDLWNAYFINGKVQICPVIITYDEFDPMKLKERRVNNIRYSYQ